MARICDDDSFWRQKFIIDYPERIENVPRSIYDLVDWKGTYHQRYRETDVETQEYVRHRHKLFSPYVAPAEVVEELYPLIDSGYFGELTDYIFYRVPTTNRYYTNHKKFIGDLADIVLDSRRGIYVIPPVLQEAIQPIVDERNATLPESLRIDLDNLNWGGLSVLYGLLLQENVADPGMAVALLNMNELAVRR
jgi:hypothetical protein